MIFSYINFPFLHVVILESKQVACLNSVHDFAMEIITRGLFSLWLLFVFRENVDTVSETGIPKRRNFVTNESEDGWESHHSRQQLREESQLTETSVIHERGVDSDVNGQTCRDTNIWFVWDDETKSCHCGDELNGVVYCDTVTKELSVINCHCLTIHFTTQGTTLPVVGRCIFNCANFTQFHDKMYHGAPSDCGSLNRQGTLCGQCLDGYTVPAYSYELKCIRCDSELENWGLYIVFAFVPLTVFIVIILVFRINIVSPEVNVFVFAAQGVSIPIFLRPLLYLIGTKKAYVSVPIRVIIAFYGIWNLDFLRVNILPDVCINASSLHILVLDYLIAIYPMLLMAVAYTIVELYGFGFRPLLYMWKPFHYFFARFRRQWGIQTTIMDAFVTFFFLSTTKLLSVSCDLLIGTSLFTNDGKLYSWNLYYDSSIEYFGREHLPYALLAIGILTVFIAFPTSLLMCYQCKLFHKCLRKCHIKDAMLDEFVNTFQKYYKDGSNGTWDCRWFAGFFILLKSLAYVTYAVSLSGISYFLLIFLLQIGAIIILIVEPYKEEHKVFNVISTNLVLWLALLFTFSLYLDVSSIVQLELNDHSFSAVVLLSLVPLVYIVVVIIHHLIRRFRGEKGGDELTCSLPHRLLHSDQYRDSFGYIAAFTQSLHDSDH